MIQIPSPSVSSSVFSDRIQALRAEIKRQDLNGFLVPMADPFLSEYVPPSDRRIEFLTGFTGSAAFVVVLTDRAAFFTDSRYTLQAADQVPTDLFAQFDTAQKTPTDWLKENLRTQMKIGFDPRLHSARQIERMETEVIKLGASLTPATANPIDQIWKDRPEAPCAPIVPHEAIYAGKASALKRRELAEDLKKRGINAAILTDPASVAWLLNIRGGDLPHTPLPHSTAILRADDTVEWFVDQRKAPKGIERHLGNEVSRFAPDEFAPALKRLGEARSRVLIDPDETPYWIASLLAQSGAPIERAADPCALPRACKNNTEIDGMRAAHRRDGAAMVRLLAWLDETAPKGGLKELDVADKLAALRAEASLHRGPSFDTISGAGPNGAIVHYRPTQESNRPLDMGNFLLLDSGAQYLDGTTDITRTIAIGELTAEMKDRYTRVLKGHIALSAIRFPAGTCGADLDVLARQFLWEAGLDYGHGTGHGVGSYLSVHEGPQSISRRGNVGLRPGMVVSNEPGVYKPRHYGIRIENLQYVVELFEISSPEMKMYGFEPLTLVPYDRRAIIVDMLTKTERDWVNAYHARVHKALRPQLDEATAKWLAQATEKI